MPEQRSGFGYYSRKLADLPANLREQVLKIERRYGAEWTAKHGRPRPNWVRALHIQRAMKKVLEPMDGRRRAGRKSYQVRCERYGVDAVHTHLRAISGIAVAAKKFKRKTGKSWDGTPVISRPRVEIIDWRESEFKHKGNIERNLAGI